jgi:hypothetical protein
MKKFVVHTRPFPGCCKGAGDLPTIVEVEGEVVSSLEDPSVTWLRQGEFYFRIMAPEALYEPHEAKQPDGSKKKTMVPTVYHSHAIYHTLVEAQAAAKRMIKSGLDFEVRKGRLTSYTDEELTAKCGEIQTVMLT